MTRADTPAGLGHAPRWRTFWREFARDRAAVVSLWVIVGVAAVAVAAPVLPLPDPAGFSREQYVPPQARHPMGTDNLGRDMLSRVVWGSRLGLGVAVVSAGISSVLGIGLGALSGYYGGWIDDVLSRVFDVFLLIPAFFLALLIIALFGPSIYFIMIIIGITTWPRPARIMRSQVLTLKTRPFVQAVLASGASHVQVLFRHIIPNGIAPVITNATLLMGGAILIEAGLSFLGLGDPNTVSWGQLIQDGQKHLRLAAWMSFFPGILMLLTVCAFNLIGDGLNQALSPHMRERRGSRDDHPPPTAPVAPRATGAVIQDAVSERPILEVANVTMRYMLEGADVRAVDDVSLQLKRGQSIGLVGESGSGKTSLGLTLMRVLPRNAEILGGTVHLGGQEVLRIPDQEFQRVRWNRIAMIFQSAMNSLNPVVQVGQQLTQAYRLHSPRSGSAEALDRVRGLFETVGIPAARIRAYPHELSGGMRQRVMIAMALLVHPEVIIADEPTTALDVLVQDQILGELDRLRAEMNLSMILISHDAGIVAETCERMAVMYAGQIVELGPSSELFGRARHPYTRGLFGSVPTLTGPRRALISIPGESVVARQELRGCRFAPRCPIATDLCRTVDPPMVAIAAEHVSRCHYALESRVESAWTHTEASHAP
jgi:peptide/nickel transport system permease protein